jgi:hypothetical protein
LDKGGRKRDGLGETSVRPEVPVSLKQQQDRREVTVRCRVLE